MADAKVRNTTDAAKRAPRRRGRRAPFEAPTLDALPGHLVGLLGELLAGGSRPDPTVAYGAAGRRLQHTSWAGYRAGRSRLAGLVGVYLNWLVPPPGWLFKGLSPGSEGRAGLLWSDPTGGVVLVDQVTSAGARDTLLSTAAKSELAAHQAALSGRDGFVGVRVLALGAPTFSLLAEGSRRRPLDATPFWFGARP